MVRILALNLHKGLLPVLICRKDLFICPSLRARVKTGKSPLFFLCGQALIWDFSFACLIDFYITRRDCSLQADPHVSLSPS